MNDLGHFMAYKTVLESEHLKREFLLNENKSTYIILLFLIYLFIEINIHIHNNSM